jgi:hypothetical protein
VPDQLFAMRGGPGLSQLLGSCMSHFLSKLTHTNGIQPACDCRCIQVVRYGGPCLLHHYPDLSIMAQPRYSGEMVPTSAR